MGAGAGLLGAGVVALGAAAAISLPAADPKSSGHPPTALPTSGTATPSGSPTGQSPAPVTTTIIVVAPAAPADGDDGSLTGLITAVAGLVSAVAGAYTMVVGARRGPAPHPGRAAPAPEGGTP
ncbi:hypothetical protein AB0K43_16235 [Kitasatospora sp. NPDC049258]|uniref:hypothetical protein n=1 Tax=Kitasatospora sp. NPDC049258 TaxID=3155394 RepID=UPI003441500C